MQTSVTADILENANGEILVAVALPDGDPGDATVDVKTDAIILKRTADQELLIENVDPDLCDRMVAREEIMVAETATDGIVNAYQVPVTRVVS